MPELPEVQTVVETLRPYVTGRRIVRAEFHSRFVTPGDRDALASQVAGRWIQTVRRHGKFILMELDRGVLAVHLGMTGQLLVSGQPGTHTHGFFELDQGVLLYDDPRQFGRIEFSETTPSRVAALGPDALAITCTDFAARTRKRHSRIKPLLLNQRFLAGLGNIYVDEALFRAGIHPFAIASRLTARRVTSLFDAIGEVLRESIEAGGSSISDYVDAEGQRGAFQDSHRVYGREGEACVMCGAPVKRILVAQRGTHFCPRCQKK